MHIFKRSLVSISASLALAGLLSLSAEADISTTLSGYGTVGGSLTSDNDFQYIHDPSEFSGAGHQIDIGLDSRIGVQAVVDFGSGFSVTAQEVAKQRGDTKFSLGTEWLFAQYAPDPDWKFRLGRVAMAAFLYSDSRNVGYAAPWFHAPNEIYAAEPFQNLDGAQIVWHHTLGPVGLGLSGSYGNTELPVEVGGTQDTVKAKSATNVAATVEYGDFLFRLAQTNLNQNVQLAPTLSFFLKDKFVSAGLQYDNGTAMVLSEYAKRSQNSVPELGGEVLKESSEWYVAGGWRFGKWTPLVSYAQTKPVASLTSPAGKFSTPSASLRYDVVTNVALKAQVSRAQAGNADYWTIPNLASGEHINVYSLGADFVF